MVGQVGVVVATVVFTGIDVDRDGAQPGHGVQHVVSRTLGDLVRLTQGQVGVGGHLHVGRGVKATGQTGITHSLEPEDFVSGCPSIPNREWLKSSAVFPQLPALKKRVAELEQRIADLQEKLDECLTRLDR